MRWPVPDLFVRENRNDVAASSRHIGLKMAAIGK